MKKKILINAQYPEERRVAIIDGDTLVDFYVEVSAREHLKGNIYKGVVARVEPGLQAVFVNFGPKKQGFLQMREIMPQYYGKKTEDRRPRVQDVMVKGQEIVVQVEKDERDTKGASLTTYISLAGRYIVMMPGQDRVGVSRKIEDREDRDRMKDMFKALKLPKNMGFILRTAGGDSSQEGLENDLKYLTKLWAKIQRDLKKAKAPALIHKEQDFAVRTARDYITSDVSEVIVDDQDAIRNIKDFLKKTSPWQKVTIKHYKDRTPIFTHYHVDEQIAKIHDRYVHLPSRGYLVIDKTEALTAIDVNSGRSRKEEHVEATALRTNLEAADEIARQLRLRDLGGLVVIDFIDMMSSKNRREVENRLRAAMADDKAHYETTPISKFGIVEMTRERMRPAYLDMVHRQCDACGGTGIIKTDEMVAIEALREIHTRAARGKVTAVTCRLPVESMNYLINTWREEIVKTEKDNELSIRLVADAHLHAGQYKLDAEGGVPEEPVPQRQKVQVRPPRQQKEQPRPSRPELEEEEPDAETLAPEIPEGGDAVTHSGSEAHGGEKRRRGRRRRGRRRKGGSQQEGPQPRQEQAQAQAEGAGDAAGRQEQEVISAETKSAETLPGEKTGRRRRRSRRRRGGHVRTDGQEQPAGEERPEAGSPED
ncbi:MAG: Rne/Rng family ribonuclease [Thermodesulfovibrionales bacterium]